MKYYLHDTNSFYDEKITELFIKFGYEGLGLFYTALEKFALQEKPIKTSVLKSQLKVGKKLEKCWKFLEEIDLISSNNGESFNKQLLNFSEKFTIKKEKNKIRIAEWRKNQEDAENVTRYESIRNTHKDNISKVKLNKVNKSKIKDDSETSVSGLSYQPCLDYWLKEFHPDFKFTGREGKSLKEIIAEIERRIKLKGNEPTVENILEGFKILCLKLPSWYKNKDLSTINSKINEVLEQIINANTTNPNDERIAGRLTKGQVEEFINRPSDLKF